MENAAPIGKKVKQLRERTGITQLEFASLLGVSQVFVCLMEKGLRVPTYKLLLKMGEVLDTQIKEIIEVKGLTIDPEKRELIEDILSLIAEFDVAKIKQARKILKVL